MTPNQCSVESCDRPVRVKARMLCHSHYMRFLRTGATDTPIRSYARASCSVDGCDRSHHGRGLCRLHYTRSQQFGDVHREKQMPKAEAHWNWAGEDASYTAVHKRLARDRGLAAAHSCAHCSGPAEQWAYDHLDPDERIAQPDEAGHGCRYSLDQARYIPLCTSCHRRFDIQAS